MSKEIVEQKKKEIDEFTKEEENIKEEMRNDQCPVCKTHTSNFKYVLMLPAPMGWIECPVCGCVFCPESLRRRKLAMGIIPPSSGIIVPS